MADDQLFQSKKNHDYLNRKALSPDDKRYLPRWKVRNRVKCSSEYDAHSSHECETLDLSCAGTCLKSSQMLKRGEQLRMKIYLDEDHAVDVKGKVVWSNISENGRYAGIRFDYASLEMQDLILNYAFEIDPDKMIKHWFSGWHKW